MRERPKRQSTVVIEAVSSDNDDMDDFKPSLSLRKKFLQRLKEKMKLISESEDSHGFEVTPNNIGGESNNSTLEIDATGTNDSSNSMNATTSAQQQQQQQRDIERASLPLSVTNQLIHYPKLINLCGSYYVEQYLGKEDHAPIMYGVKVEIEYPENDALEYAEKFFPKEHQNFIGEDDTRNVIAVSVMKSSKSTELDQFRALVRTEERDEHMEISKKSKVTRRSLSKEELLTALRPRFSLRTLVKADDPKIKESLIMLEKSQCVKKYKCGILYCAASQTAEGSMFSNTHGSEQWNEFLEFLGKKVELKGFTGFAGGLDVKYESTGSHSIFNEWKNYQIMFHVSTLLPHATNDSQQLERKRHIGNDVVVIIFKEPNTVYDPTTITSHFIHVIIVIEPFIYEGETYYRMEVVSKSGVPYFGPKIMQPIFKKDEYFHDFLLTKMINGERAAYYSPEFRPKITRTRSQILQYCADYVKPGNTQSVTKLVAPSGRSSTSKDHNNINNNINSSSNNTTTSSSSNNNNNNTNNNVRLNMHSNSSNSSLNINVDNNASGSGNNNKKGNERNNSSDTQNNNGKEKLQNSPRRPASLTTSPLRTGSSIFGKRVHRMSLNFLRKKSPEKVQQN